MEGLRTNVLVRVEVDQKAHDLILPGPMSLPNEWAEREATVRIASCREIEAPEGKGLCDGVSFLASHKTPIKREGQGLSIEVPTAPILCIDGTQATFGKK